MLSSQVVLGMIIYVISLVTGDQPIQSFRYEDVFTPGPAPPVSFVLDL